jgi:hypothetical protein
MFISMLPNSSSVIVADTIPSSGTVLGAVEDATYDKLDDAAAMADPTVEDTVTVAAGNNTPAWRRPCRSVRKCSWWN